LLQALNRDEFIVAMNKIIRNEKNDCADEDHVLWNAEKFSKKHRVRCKWFVCVCPIDTEYKYHPTGAEDESYWPWIGKTLTGEIVCYSSDPTEKEEWWGFTEQNDITLWALKWVK
jgi:hypothetical protein